MILDGDEFGRTQLGNNNAYCQDNEISWVNWDKIGTEGKAQTTFVRKLTMLRHALPVLRRNRYLDATYDEKLDVKALTWINATGSEMDEGNWKDNNLRCFGMLMDGRGQSSGIKRPADDVTLLMVMNSNSDMVQFTLPAFAGGKWWVALVDTNEPERDECPRLQSATQYAIAGRSLVLFAAITPGKTGQIVRRMAFEMSRAVEPSHVIARPLNALLEPNQVCVNAPLISWSVQPKPRIGRGWPVSVASASSARPSRVGSSPSPVSTTIG